MFEGNVQFKHSIHGVTIEAKTTTNQKGGVVCYAEYVPYVEKKPAI